MNGKKKHSAVVQKTRKQPEKSVCCQLFQKKVTCLGGLVPSGVEPRQDFGRELVSIAASPPSEINLSCEKFSEMERLEAEGKGTKASEGKCGNVKRGVVVTGLFLWSIYSKTCSDILHKAVSYRY